MVFLTGGMSIELIYKIIIPLPSEHVWWQPDPHYRKKNDIAPPSELNKNIIRSISKTHQSQIEIISEPYTKKNQNSIGIQSAPNRKNIATHSDLYQNVIGSQSVDNIAL